MSRHEKRQRLKELRKVMKAVERRGAGHRPEMAALAALVALLDSAMAGTPVPGRSTKAMALLARMLDKGGESAPDSGKIACREGCVWCCDLYVSAPAPQIFAIADHIRATAADMAVEIARLEAADAATRGKDAAARAGENLLCPFLADGRCGIYAVRPAACRTHCSFSAAACEAAFRGGPEEIPVPDHIPALRGGVEQALAAVLDNWRLPAGNYELTHAVLVALRVPDAEARWYDGVDVFTGVQTDEADRPTDADTRRVEAEYRRILWAVAHGDAADGPFAESFPPWCR